MTTATHPDAPESALIRELGHARISFELVPHERAETARGESHALRVAPAGVAKTVVVRTGDSYVRTVVRASDRLDERKVSDALDDPHVRLATEQELAAAYPSFELGAVAPFAGPADDRVVVDRRVASLDSVFIEAGRHDLSIRLSPDDLVQLASAKVADLVSS